ILNAAAREAEAFEDKFWSGIELSRLYQESQGKRDNLTGSEQIKDIHVSHCLNSATIDLGSARGFILSGSTQTTRTSASFSK
ncbi:hypothetical protein ACSLNR_29995, partial [Escherichia coli]